MIGTVEPTINVEPEAGLMISTVGRAMTGACTPLVSEARRAYDERQNTFEWQFRFWSFWNPKEVEIDLDKIELTEVDDVVLVHSSSNTQLSLCCLFHLRSLVFVCQSLFNSVRLGDILREWVYT